LNFSGKTKIIDTFCSIFNKNLYSDTIDDSVTGSFQQFDFNRWLEEVSQSVEAILFDILCGLAVGTHENARNKEMVVEMVKLWLEYNSSFDQKDGE
jgi:midasin